MTPDSSDSAPEAALETIFYRTDRVRFADWDRFSGARATVALVAITAILSFVTGLSTLSQDDVVLDGPLAAILPEVTTVVRFGGVLAAFVLGIVAFGLNRQKRLAWYVAVVLLPLVGLLPLVTLQSTHFPLLLLVVITTPLLILNRKQFTDSLDLSPLQIAAISSIVGVLAYGSIGSYALRDQFTAVETWSDSVYYVVVTIATVGYGDITPTSTQAKWFSLSVIIFGTGAFTAAIGALIVPAIEKRMASAFGNMTPSSLRLLEDHVLVLGYSDITDSVIEELEGKTEVVVITPDPDDAAKLDERGVQVLTADPTDEDTLREAGVDLAQGVVIGTRDDARDVMAVLATKKVNPDIRVVAAANEPRFAERFRDVGADHVISPFMIGGKMLGRSVLVEEKEESFLEAMGPALGEVEDEEAGEETTENE